MTALSPRTIRPITMASCPVCSIVLNVFFTFFSAITNRIFIGSAGAAFRHVITFGGHPVASAAALKNIEIMERERMVENSAAMGTYLLDGLKELKEKHQIIGDVRGLGLMCGMELVKDRKTKESFPPEADLAARLTQGFSDNGVLLRGGDAMNIMPPLCVTAGEIDDILLVMDRVFEATSKDLGAG